MLIALQADGTYRGDSKRQIGKLGGYHIIEFQFSKQRKIDRLVEICKRGNFKYKVSKPTSRLFSKHNGRWNDQTAISVYLSTKPFKHFEQWVDINDKSYEWCSEFIEEVS